MNRQEVVIVRHLQLSSLTSRTPRQQTPNCRWFIFLNFCLFCIFFNLLPFLASCIFLLCVCVCEVIIACPDTGQSNVRLTLLELMFFVSSYIISHLAASHCAVGNVSIIPKEIFTECFKQAIPKIFHYMPSRSFPPHPAFLAFVF